MTARLRSTLGWSAAALCAAGLTATLVLRAQRAEARGEIFARLREVQVERGPLDGGTPAQAPSDATAQIHADLAARSPFDPFLWEPPAESGLGPDEFGNLVFNRMQEEELTLEERELIALWLASLDSDLAALRSLAGRPRPVTHERDSDRLTFDILDATLAFACRAVLAAHEGDVDGAIEHLSAAFEVQTLLDDDSGGYSFVSWLACGGITLAMAERVVELLPEGSDLSVLASWLDERDVDEFLRRAFASERLLYLESLGILRDGELRPEADLTFPGRSRWRPWTWTPAAERQVLADLSAFELLIEEGRSLSSPASKAAASSNVQEFATNAAAAADVHVAAVARLRARLAR